MDVATGMSFWTDTLGCEPVKTDSDLILVYSPTYVGKEPVLDQWQAGIDALTYQPRSLFVIDNTTTAVAPHFEYLRTLQDRGINAVHLEPWRDKPMEYTLHRCWELCLEEAKRQGAMFIYSVEADNVPAPESLTVMHAMARYGNCHLVTHEYPMHVASAEASGVKMDSFYYTEFGCMFLSTQLLERALEEYDEHITMAHSVFMAVERYRGGRIVLTRRFEVKHLDCWSTEFPQFNDLGGDLPLVCPTPYMPSEFSTEIPPSLQPLYKEA